MAKRRVETPEVGTRFRTEVYNGVLEAWSDIYITWDLAEAQAALTGARRAMRVYFGIYTPIFRIVWEENTIDHPHTWVAKKYDSVS